MTKALCESMVLYVDASVSISAFRSDSMCLCVGACICVYVVLSVFLSLTVAVYCMTKCFITAPRSLTSWLIYWNARLQT